MKVNNILTFISGVFAGVTITKVLEIKNKIKNKKQLTWFEKNILGLGGKKDEK